MREPNRGSFSAVEVHGTSLAAMVCADVLHRGGVPVRLRIDGRDPAVLGRSFRPVVVDGVKLEAGARLLELDYGDDPSPDPDPRVYEFGQHRWHMGLVSEYVRTLVEPVEAALWIDRDGRTSPDFLLTSNLHDLAAACSAWELAKIEREASSACAVLGRDGIERSLLAQMTYRAASITLHGWAFHQSFVAPLLDAIVGRDGDLPALDHRRVWLPLFTPGEVLDACRGQSTRPVRKMYSGMGAAVDALAARVEPLIDADLPGLGPRAYVVDGARAVTSSVDLRFVWALNPRPSEPSMVWRVGSPLFRATQIGRVVCWEARGDAPVFRGKASGVADRVVSYPLAEVVEVDTRAGLVGAGSFNEQVCQGISAAAWRLNR